MLTSIRLRLWPSVVSALADRSGATALEFALIAPVFLGLICMILETAILMYSQSMLDMATSGAARTIETGQVQDGGGQGLFQSTLCSTATAMLLDCSKLVFAVQSGSQFAVLDPLQAPPGSSSFAAGGPGDAVLVQVFYTQPPILPLANALMLGGGNAHLSSTVAFRNGTYQ